MFKCEKNRFFVPILNMGDRNTILQSKRRIGNVYPASKMCSKAEISQSTNQSINTLSHKPVHKLSKEEVQERRTFLKEQLDVKNMIINQRSTGTSYRSIYETFQHCVGKQRRLWFIEPITVPYNPFSWLTSCTSSLQAIKSTTRTGLENSTWWMVGRRRHWTFCLSMGVGCSSLVKERDRSSSLEYRFQVD